MDEEGRSSIWPYADVLVGCGLLMGIVIIALAVGAVGGYWMWCLVPHTSLKGVITAGATAGIVGLLLIVGSFKLLTSIANRLEEWRTKQREAIT